MIEFEMNMYQAASVAAIMLWIGSIAINKSKFLGKYYIPAPNSPGYCILN